MACALNKPVNIYGQLKIKSVLESTFFIGRKMYRSLGSWLGGKVNDAVGCAKVPFASFDREGYSRENRVDKGDT